MLIAVWSDIYEAGFKELDDQHKRLFEAINYLSGCFQTGGAEAAAKESLVFLSEYTQEHFETEEEFMRAMNYPMLAFHKREHTELLTRVQNLMVRMDEGFLVTAEVTTFLAAMFKHHVNESDMGYVAFAQEQQARLQPAGARSPPCWPGLVRPAAAFRPSDAARGSLKFGVIQFADLFRFIFAILGPRKGRP